MPIVPATFAALDLPAIRALLPRGDQGADDNELLYSGEHWAGGRMWVGEVPNDDSRAAFLLAVERGFIAINHIREVCDRHRAGILGREPAWRLTPRRALADGEEPNADEQARIAEAEALLTAWWDARDILPWLQHPATALLLAGRTVARLHIPRGLLALDDAATGLAPVPRAGDPATRLAAALDLLYVDTPARDLCAVVTDDATRARLGLYAYRNGDRDWAEATYLDERGDTVLRVLGSGGASGSVDAAQAFPLGGRLLLYEARREPLIDAQVRKLQQAANLNLTNLGRNLNLAGSRERTFLGAQPPGYYRNTATGQPWRPGDDPNAREFVPVGLPTGAGVDRFLQGVPLYNDRGEQIGMTTPSLHYEQPVSVETFRVADTLFRAAILGATYQLHALIAGDAAASGESRKQARAEFAASLGLTRVALDGLGRWLVETPLALAAALAGLPDRYADLRCQFAVTVDPGPLTADERAEYVTQWQAGGLSLETLLARLGEDDVASEIARIAAERQAGDAALVGAVAGPAPGAVDPAAALAAQLGQGG